MALHQYYPAPPPHNYRYELHKDFVFSAAHFIPDERAGACSNIHGHNYHVDLTIAGDEVDELGFLANFSTLKKLVHKRFDHDMMNNAMADIPSTELVAKEIWNTIQNYLDEQGNNPKCLQVMVRETDTSYVLFRPNL